MRVARLAVGLLTVAATTTACKQSDGVRFSGPLSAIADSALAGTRPSCDSVPAAFETQQTVSWLCVASRAGATITVSGNSDHFVGTVSLQWSVAPGQIGRLEGLLAERLVGRPPDYQACRRGAGVHEYRHQSQGMAHVLLVDSTSRSFVDVWSVEPLPSCRSQ